MCSVCSGISTNPVDLCIDTKKLIFGISFAFYTPGIYAEGYIVFVFPFVCSYVDYVRSFVCSFVLPSHGICVKVSQVVYISATTHQKAFIFGP